MEKSPCPFPIFTLPLIMMNLDLTCPAATHIQLGYPVMGTQVTAHLSVEAPLPGTMLAISQLIP